MKLIFTLILVLGLMISTISYAEMTVKNYKAAIKDETLKVIAENHINGIGIGIVWTNNYVTHRKQKPLFCEPDKLSLNGANYIAILDDQIEKLKTLSDLDDKSVAMLLLYGLIETFPCK
jgi:hypothetical protein